MKKLSSLLLAWFMLASATPSFAQEDPYKKFGIPERFRNYRIVGERIEDLILRTPEKSFYVKRWDINLDGCADVIEYYELINGSSEPEENAFIYFFDGDGNCYFDFYEVFIDSLMDGFNGNEERFAPAPYIPKDPFSEIS